MAEGLLDLHIQKLGDVMVVPLPGEAASASLERWIWGEPRAAAPVPLGQAEHSDGDLWKLTRKAVAALGTDPSFLVGSTSSATGPS